MATLESLYPTIQTALTDYGKGIVGFAGGVPIDASTSERVAKGQTIQMLEPEVGGTGTQPPQARAAHVLERCPLTQEAWSSKRCAMSPSRSPVTKCWGAEGGEYLSLHAKGDQKRDPETGR